MKMPGYTADASIYRNKGQYRMLRGSVSASGKTSVYLAGSIKPAALTECAYNCILCGYSGPNSSYCQYCQRECGGE